MSLLTKGNSKLGPGVWAFSVPARNTCPGRTPACTARCYAYAIERLRPVVRAKYRANLQAAKRPDFAAVLAAEVAAKKVAVLRVHVSGDLFSPAYAWAVARATRKCPDAVFYLYTRSWRRPGFGPVLAHLAARPNVRLWYSADRDSGLPPRLPPGVRVAYLQLTKDDRPPAGVHLVFRDHGLRRLPAEVVPDVTGAAVPVCPTETGTPAAESVTCAACGTCWRAPPPTPRTAAGRQGRVSLL